MIFSDIFERKYRISDIYQRYRRYISSQPWWGTSNDHTILVTVECREISHMLRLVQISDYLAEDSIRRHGPWTWVVWTGVRVHGLCSLVSKTSTVNTVVILDTNVDGRWTWVA